MRSCITELRNWLDELRNWLNELRNWLDECEVKGCVVGLADEWDNGWVRVDNDGRQMDV
jgi:hypothetical protein